MNDPFATLGLERRFEIDPTRLEARYRELQRVLHPDRHAGASASARELSLVHATEVNEAYRTLRDETKRAEALLALHGRTLDETSEKPDPEFLMEMIELRETLGEATAGGDAASVEALEARVEAMRQAARAELADAFGRVGEGGDANAPSNALSEAERALGRIKYFRRFLSEAEAAREGGP